MKLSYLMCGPQSSPTKYDCSISGALPEASRWSRIGFWSRIDFSMVEYLSHHRLRQSASHKYKFGNDDKMTACNM